MIVVLYNNWTLFLITWRLKINDLSLSPITDQLNQNLWWVCHILAIVKNLFRWIYRKTGLRITILESKTSPGLWQVETGREGWSGKSIQTREYIEESIEFGKSERCVWGSLIIHAEYEKEQRRKKKDLSAEAGSRRQTDIRGSLTLIFKICKALFFIHAIVNYGLVLISKWPR